VSDHVDDDYDGEPLHFHMVDDIISNASLPRLAARAIDDLKLHMCSAEEPPTFTAAEQDQKWRRTMMEEMAAIEENRTWELVDPPMGCRLIGLK
jgi:hypothetical protein